MNSMSGFNIKKAVGYGVGVYVVLFLYWSLLMAFGQGEAAWGMYVSLAITLFAARFAAVKTGATDMATLIKYAVVFAIMMALCDVVITVRFTGFEIFSMLGTYVAYAITFLGAISAVWCPRRDKAAAPVATDETASFGN